MSYYSRSKSIVESLLNKTYSDEDYVALLETLINYQEAQNLSNEEKAQGFIHVWTEQLKTVVRQRAESKVRREAEVQATQAGEDAVNNL